MSTKLVIDAGTGLSSRVTLTPAEENAHAQRAVDHTAAVAAKVASDNARDGRNTATLARLGMTQTEFNELNEVAEGK